MFLPLELTLKPSRIYPPILLLGSVLAAGGMTLADLPVWAALLATVALLAGLAWSWRKRQLAARGLRISQSGQLAVLLGDWQAASLQGPPVVLPWLVRLRVMTENGAKIRLLVWRDSTDADSFRRLRVWLRWAAAEKN